MKMPNCYVCNYPANDYVQKVDGGYSIIKCGRCGLEYTDPIPDPAMISSFYQNYSDIRADEEILRRNAVENLKTLSQYGWTSESATLDFGTGKGIFLEVAGKNCYGLDIVGNSNERIKKSIDELDASEFDFVTLWGVLEHLTDPKSTIRNLSHALRGEGGVIALTTVNAEGLIPYYYKPPEHLTYWTRSAFDILARETSMEIVAYFPYFMHQKGTIYLQRLLSRTPVEYVDYISDELPDTVFVPTNEVFVVLRK
jgi:hypothetical protein